MLDRVHFENYKALRDVTVDLERLTVFVGPNGSGKTSILEAVFDLAQLLGRPPHQVFWKGHPFENFYRAGAEGPMRLEGVSGGAPWKSEVKQSEFAGAETSARTPYPRRISRNELLPPELRSPESAEERRINAFCDNTVFLRLNAAAVSAPSYSESPTPTVAHDGSGVASSLAYLKLNHEGAFRQLLDNLGQIVPTVRDIRFSRVSIPRPEVQLVGVGDKQVPFEVTREVWGDSLAFDTQSGRNIPASMMSEGTLLALGILAALSRIPKHGVVLLDDLDRALHPKAQAEVVAVLRAILEQREDLQILATSHSPYLLDSFKPEEVRLSVLNEEGGAVVAPLASHPEFDRWKDVMTAGEFWSSVGESWVGAK